MRLRNLSLQFTLMLVLWVPGAAQALSVSVSSAEGIPEDAGVVVTINVDDAAGIAGADLTLLYPSFALTATKVAGTSLLTSSGILVTPNLNTDGEVRVSLAGTSGISSGSGALISITFDVKVAASTNVVYDLTLTRAVFRNEQAQVLSVQSTTAGTFTVIGPSSQLSTLSLTASHTTIDADGSSKATLGAKLHDVSGNPFTEATTVSFVVVSGTGTLTQSQVTTSNGTAETQLSGSTAGTVVVEASAGSVSDQITVTLKSTGVVDPDEGKTPKEGDGTWSMDLNATMGDQGIRERSGVGPGQEFTVELINNQFVSPALGVDITLQYDPGQVEPLLDSIQGITDLFGSPSVEDNTIHFTLGGLSGVAVEQGHVGQITFRTLSGFSGDAEIELVQAAIGDANTFENVQAEPHTSVVVRSDSVSASPDLNRDGWVDFKDFVLFARAYGSQSGDANYDAMANLDGNSEVGFRDFVQFAQAYGKPAPKRALAKLASGSGVNGSTLLSLEKIPGDAPDQVQVLVRFTGAGNVQGYHVAVRYDEAVLELTGATAGENVSAFGGIETGSVAIQAKARPGEVFLADVMSAGNEMSGSGEFLRLRFRVMDPPATGRVEIVNVFVSGPAGKIDELAGVRMEVQMEPELFTLDQNHPNPFNPETQIVYELPQAGQVRLVIYNTLGQQVRVLVNEQQASGRYQMKWDGRDELGQQVSSGIYLYRLTVDDRKFSAARRMLLLK